MTEAAEALDPQMPHEPFEQAELPGQPDPRDIARAVAMDVADEPEQVGDVVNAIELGDNVTDFRLAADVRGMSLKIMSPIFVSSLTFADTRDGSGRSRCITMLRWARGR